MTSEDDVVGGLSQSNNCRISQQQRCYVWWMKSKATVYGSNLLRCPLLEQKCKAKDLVVYHRMQRNVYKTGWNRILYSSIMCGETIRKNNAHKFGNDNTGISPWFTHCSILHFSYKRYSVHIIFGSFHQSHQFLYHLKLTSVKC